MSFLERLYPGDGVCIIAIDVIVQIAAVSLVALLVGRTVARRNAALRHCILLAALVWIGVSPVAAWRLSRAGWVTLHLPAKAQEPINSHTAGPIEVSRSVENSKLLERTSNSRHLAESAVPERAVAELPPQPAPADFNKLHMVVGTAGLIWIGGMFVLLTRLSLGIVEVFRIRREAMQVDPDLLRPAVAHATRVVGVDRLPPILLSHRIAGPATIGAWKKAILLPGGLLAWMGEDQIRDVLIHEGTHALRHDYAIGIFQRIVGAVFWFHPVVAMLNREIRRAREEVCDNAVLRGRSPAAYSRTLLELCQRIQSASTPALLPEFLDRAWPLEHRVNGILNERRIVMIYIKNRERFAIGLGVVAMGVACSMVGVSRGQSANDEKPRVEAPATRPEDVPVAAQGGSTQGLLDRRTDFVSPSEQVLRAKMDQAQRAVHKAELGVKEAEIKSKSAQLDFKRKMQLFENKSISSSDLEEAKLAIELANVELERAELGLQEAKADATPTRLISLDVWDVEKHEGDQYPIQGSLSLYAFIQQHFRNGLDGDWEISLLRQSNTRYKTVLTGVRGLARNSTVGNQSLQSADQVIVRRDVVTVRKGSGSGSVILWKSALKGRKMSLLEVLKEAGVEFTDKNATHHVLWQGKRVGFPDKSWTARQGDIAGDFGKKDFVEPSDLIVVDYQ